MEFDENQGMNISVKSQTSLLEAEFVCLLIGNQLVKISENQWNSKKIDYGDGVTVVVVVTELQQWWWVNHSNGSDRIVARVLME